jgi:hypothetical protein
MDNTYSAALIGVSIPIIVFISILIFVCIRRRSNQSTSGYSKVNHGFDQEEIEFSNRMIPSVEDEEYGIDDLDNLYVEKDEEDFDFNSKDMDHLSMLEKFRNNLETNNYNNNNDDDDNNINNEIRL